MRVSRVINIEDDAIKHAAIKRALRSNGIKQIDRARNAEYGLEMIDNAIKEGEPYELLILDMQFTVNGVYNKGAGRHVISELKKNNIHIPIIICSSINFDILDVVGCIFYNESRNLKRDMKEMLDVIIRQR